MSVDPPTSKPIASPAPAPAKCCPLGAFARNRVERRAAAHQCRRDGCPLRR